MRVNPQSLGLEPETEEERVRRENRTGEAGTGLFVTCHPVLEDPMVSERRHRTACLKKPYEACRTCPHSSFVLLFPAQSTRYEKIACPRWKTPTSYHDGEQPESYALVEEGVCDNRPFDFCSSCPSKMTVQELQADKTKPGWFGRWQRLKGEPDVD